MFYFVLFCFHFLSSQEKENEREEREEREGNELDDDGYLLRFTEDGLEELEREKGRRWKTLRKKDFFLFIIIIIILSIYNLFYFFFF